jgi:hypothetical protein
MYPVIFRYYIDDLIELSTDIFNFLFGEEYYNISEYSEELVSKIGISGLKWCVDKYLYVKSYIIERHAIENDNAEYLPYININNDFMKWLCGHSCINLIRAIRKMNIECPFIDLSNQPRLRENNL